MQRAQHAFERLLVATRILRQSSAEAGQFRARMITGVGIQPLFQRSRGQPPRCHLQSFEIQIVDGLMG